MKLYCYYDKEADVFYFSKGKPTANVISEETSDDVIIRRDRKTGNIVGFTIINFSLRTGAEAKKPVELPIDINMAVPA